MDCFSRSFSGSIRLQPCARAKRRPFQAFPTFTRPGVFRIILLLVCVAPVALPQPANLVPVVSKPVSQTIDLPGEFQPFLTVSLHAKVPSYVERVLVDRGSVVAKGELLVDLSAPEIAAQIAEAQSKVQA